jgi:hypothetical protein
MLDEKKDTLHASRHPSLLPLRMALSAAVSESPACPPRMDVNEQRAMQLIAKVKAEYKKQQSVMNWNDIPNPRGLHANLQVMVNSNA